MALEPIRPLEYIMPHDPVPQRLLNASRWFVVEVLELDFGDYVGRPSQHAIIRVQILSYLFSNGWYVDAVQNGGEGGEWQSVSDTTTQNGGGTTSVTDSSTNTITHGSSQTNSGTQSHTSGNTRSHTSGSTHSHTSGSTGSHTSGSTHSHTSGSTGSHTSGSTHSHTSGSTGSHTSGSTHSHTSGLTHGSTYSYGHSHGSANGKSKSMSSSSSHSSAQTFNINPWPYVKSQGYAKSQSSGSSSSITNESTNSSGNSQSSTSSNTSGKTHSSTSTMTKSNTSGTTHSSTSTTTQSNTSGTTHSSTSTTTQSNASSKTHSSTSTTTQSNASSKTHSSTSTTTKSNVSSKTHSSTSTTTKSNVSSKTQSNASSTTQSGTSSQTSGKSQTYNSTASRTHSSTKTITDGTGSSNVKSHGPYWYAYVRIRLKRRKLQAELVMRDMVEDLTKAYNEGRKINDDRYDEIVNLYAIMLGRTETEGNDFMLQTADFKPLTDYVLLSMKKTVDDFHAVADNLPDEVFKNRVREINLKFDNQLSTARGELITAGLFNSTVWTTTASGIERNREMALNDLIETKIDVYVKVAGAAGDIGTRFADAAARLQQMAKERLLDPAKARSEVFKWMLDFMERRKDEFPGMDQIAGAVKQLGYAETTTSNGVK